MTIKKQIHLYEYALERKAHEIRKKTIEMCVNSGNGHLASSLSCIEILTTIYYSGLFNLNKDDEKRDRFIISKGHGGLGLYPILADIGYFFHEEFSLFTKNNGMLGLHPDKNIPGIETFTGSLGHGLGIGSGMALADKMDKTKSSTIVLIGDGECYEGSIWEAAMFAGHHTLNNLICIIDRNHLSVIDFTDEVIDLESLKTKWSSFGWFVRTLNGHSVRELYKALQYFKERSHPAPMLIIADTNKGEGIPFMQNVPSAHTTVPTKQQLEGTEWEVK